MNTVIELLGELRSKGVNLSLDGEVLKINAPKGSITPEYRTQLSARKPEIIAFLRTSFEAARGGGLTITPIPRSGSLPLSFAQQRLWFLHQLDGGGPAYNIAAGLRMEGSLDIEVLEQAIRGIIARHEALRTRFASKDGTPYAVIDPVSSWRLEQLNLQSLSEDERDHAAFGHAVEFSQISFDLAKDSLVRTLVIQTAPTSHLLVVSMHHIISDGWSMGVIVKELAETYSALKRGDRPNLPPLPLQYVDFARWQRDRFEATEQDRQLPYWKKQLAGLPPIVEFPSDYRRPPIETSRGDRSRIIISRTIVGSLEQLARANDATLFMVLLTAFKVLLYRYSGQDDTVVGTPSANRLRSELHPLIGFFVNNLVLRTPLDGNPTFVEALARVREVTLRAYDHQDVPFDTLVQALHVERSTDHSPLFQTMFSLQNFPLDELQLPGLVINPIEFNAGTSRFDLTVEIYPLHNELKAYFEYKTDIYHPDTIAAIQRHYVALLEDIVSRPTHPINSLQLLSEEERNELLFSRNRTASPYPTEICIHQRFEQLAEQDPDRIAVTTPTARLTYSQLNARANEIANLLYEVGVVTGSVVGIYLERSTDLVAGLLAILKMGGAYIPLDPIYPPMRIAGILENAKPMVVLTSEFLRPSLPAIFEPVICIDQISQLMPKTSVNPNIRVNQTELAYIIFTSGSTGKPKGVQVSHGALINFLESMSHSPGFSASDSVLAVTTISFDIAGLELYLPLYVGGSIYLSTTPNSPSVLLEELATFKPTVMQATPATWQMLINSGWKGDPNLKVLCGGEALEVELAKSLISRSNSVWNMYGPTETTIWSAALRVEDPQDYGIPIGPPIENTSFYILDSQQQVVPVGAAGELYIGGSSVANGYHNRPDLTAERFVPDPFQQDNTNKRLYRTGDLVRYKRSGEIEFLGRMDHQVKLRGFRIELGEIESFFRAQEGIRDAVVVMRDVYDDKCLVAYLLADPSGQPSETDLRSALRNALPEYMVPRFIVVLDTFPRTPNGKLDRPALPLPNRPASTTMHVAPGNEAQRVVSDTFRELLNLDHISIKDNFFELGAHSLLIAKAHDKLKHALDPGLQLIDFFQYPTIEALSNLIGKRQLVTEQSPHQN